MTAILHDAREQWLMQRRTLLTASDIAAVLGVDPRRGPLQVYLSKVKGTDTDETDWMAFGRDVEDAIAKGYERKSGRPVQTLGAHYISRHPDVPWLGATLDRQALGCERTPPPVLCHAGPVPLECKAVGLMKRQEWEEDPPLHYVIQLQFQMACTSAMWGSLCALLGGVSIVWKDLVRDDGFLESALPALEEFWMRVQRQNPPPADALPGTTEAVKRAWAEANGATVPLNDPAILDMVERWEHAKVACRQQESTVDQLANQLRVHLGDATFGALPDGSFITLKNQKRDGFTVAPTEFRVLRRWWPKGLKRANKE